MHAIRLASGFLGALIACSALAENAPPQTVVVINRDDCRRLVRYQPDPGVVYKPGVDVKGKPVVPADLDNGGETDAPKQITIDLKLPLGQIRATDGQTDLQHSDVNVGLLSIDLNDGSVVLNGRKLGESSAASVVEACRKAGIR